MLTAKDTTLTSLGETILTGWQGQARDLRQNLRVFFHCTNVLTTQDDIIFHRLRIVIPAGSRDDDKGIIPETTARHTTHYIEQNIHFNASGWSKYISMALLVGQ